LMGWFQMPSVAENPFFPAAIPVTRTRVAIASGGRHRERKENGTRRCRS
jgi:hypothetical protein